MNESDKLKSSRIAELLILAMMDRSKNELALGWLRYEALRKVSPRKFSILHHKNVAEGSPFDDLVDELLSHE